MICYVLYNIDPCLKQRDSAKREESFWKATIALRKWSFSLAISKQRSPKQFCLNVPNFGLGSNKQGPKKLGMSVNYIQLLWRGGGESSVILPPTPYVIPQQLIVARGREGGYSARQLIGCGRILTRLEFRFIMLTHNTWSLYNNTAGKFYCTAAISVVVPDPYSGALWIQIRIHTGKYKVKKGGNARFNHSDSETQLTKRIFLCHYFQSF